MAASRPARPLLQETRVVDCADKNVAGYFLLLKMAFQTKRRVAFIEQALVHRAVRRMTDAAPLPHRFVLIDERAALLRVTLEAGFVSADESKPASFKPLLNICGRAFDGDPFVWLMAIATAHLAFWHRMVVR